MSFMRPPHLASKLSRKVGDDIHKYVRISSRFYSYDSKRSNSVRREAFIINPGLIPGHMYRHVITGMLRVYFFRGIDEVGETKTRVGWPTRQKVGGWSEENTTECEGFVGAGRRRRRRCHCESVLRDIPQSRNKSQ